MLASPLKGFVGYWRWWVGRDNTVLTEPNSSHANTLKTCRSGEGASCDHHLGQAYEGWAISSVQQLARHTKCDGVHAMLLECNLGWGVAGGILMMM
jgi:hypothetical protein